MGKKQSAAFLDGEGQQWLNRNVSKITPGTDPVIDVIEGARIRPDSVLEVGCSDGWRVRRMKKDWGAQSFGIDPMPADNKPNCFRGTASDLGHFGDREVGMVIYGWCLYLCDREDLFTIVAEGDRVLKDGGYIVIHDFHVAKPYKRKYKHLKGLFSFKMDHSLLWLANPNYSLVNRVLFDSGDDRTSITILRKSLDGGWPLHE